MLQMKDQKLSKWFWYISMFQLLYIALLILLSYMALQNETLIFISRFVGELITIPVVLGVLFCLVYFGLKLLKEQQRSQYALIFSVNLFTAALMVYFTFLQL
jgi:hypothetical protein